MKKFFTAGTFFITVLLVFAACGNLAGGGENNGNGNNGGNENNGGGENNGGNENNNGNENNGGNGNNGGDSSDPSTTLYTITKGGTTNGTFEVSHTSTAAGEVVTVTASPSTGYRAGEVSVSGGVSCTAAGADTWRFTMPAAHVTVTVTFELIPAEDPNTGIPIGNPSVKLYLDGSGTPLAHNESTTLSVDSGAAALIRIDGGTYSEIIWYINGAKAAEGPGVTSVSLPRRTAGTFMITVEATPQGGVKNSGVHTFVIE